MARYFLPFSSKQSQIVDLHISVVVLQSLASLTTLKVKIKKRIFTPVSNIILPSNTNPPGQSSEQNSFQKVTI